MTIYRKLAVALGVAMSIVALTMAARYGFADEFMPYHAVLSGTRWDQLSPGMQQLIRAMMIVGASGFAGTGLAMLGFLIPIARGERWAAWALFVAGIVQCIPLTWVTTHIRLTTGAQAPVGPSVAGLVTVILIVLMSELDQRERRRGSR